MGENFNSLNKKLTETNNALGEKQEASTAINTSNIGSQSVNYANNANYSNSAGSAAKDGSGNIIANTYLKGKQNDNDFIQRPSVNVSGTIVPLITSSRQSTHIYPIVNMYVRNDPEKLIIDWYADGNLITSHVDIYR